MKKILSIFIFVFAAATVNVAAQTIRDLFVEMPDSLLPHLTENDRLDCIDFLDAGMEARVMNVFDSYSELETLADDYLLLRTSDSGTMQVKLLPAGSDTIICIIHTLCAEACDSRVNFYNMDWTPAAVNFEMPAISDFFIPGDSAEYFIERADIYLVELKMLPKNNDIVAEYTLPNYMPHEEAQRMAAHLRPVRYRWKGGRYMLVKE